MNLAVKKYASVVLKPAGIPDEWPAEVRELGENTALPEGDGWVLMTITEYNAHREQYQADYDAFLVAYNNSAEVLEQKIAAKISAASAFGRRLIYQTAAKMLLSGYTYEQIAEVSIYLNDEKNLIESGGLYAALVLLNQKQTTELFTQSIKDFLINSINTFLGI